MSIQVITNSPRSTERRRGKQKYQKPFQSPLALSPPEEKEGKRSFLSSFLHPSFVVVTFIIVVILPSLLWSGNTNTKEEDRSLIVNPSENNHDASGSPEIVWLMSFPNSGTSYTLQYVTTSSNTTVGTNYEAEVKYGKSIPISSKSPDGPFILYDKRKLPSQYILTKTHCSGYCTDCDISSYILDRFDFQRGCATNRLINQRDDLMPHGAKVYDHNVEVKKIIRLVRDPFSNIASNFHLWLKQQKRQGTGLEKDYTDDEEGFMKFCSYYDETFQKKMTEIDQKHLHKKRFLENISNQLEGVPCHQYFVRYIVVSDENIFIIYLFRSY